MGAGLLAVKSGFILFIKNYQFPIQINTLERESDTAGFPPIKGTLAYNSSLKPHKAALEYKKAKEDRASKLVVGISGCTSPVVSNSVSTNELFNHIPFPPFFPLSRYDHGYVRINPFCRDMIMGTYKPLIIMGTYTVTAVVRPSEEDDDDVPPFPNTIEEAVLAVAMRVSLPGGMYVHVAKTSAKREVVAVLRSA
jgi:hypothetical protein